ncbi:MAG: LamG domain-containing protein, partial [Actinomycetota bacterium]|nr:LamG domain-containing protein [Actinomycetota bacterium]
GTIDEVAVYGTALSESRIQAHYIAGRAYRDAVLDRSPVSYWRLGESSGTTATDETGVNNGTYQNSPTLNQPGAIAGNQNTAVTFDGSTGYVNVPDSASLDLGDQLTIEAWVKRAANGANHRIVSKGTGAYALRLGSNNKLELLKEWSSVIVGSTTTITDTNWHHVAATKNGATAKLYIDGVDVTGTVTNATLVNTADNLAIGREQPSGTEDFNGTVDEVALYNSALSATQVKLHYDAGRDAPR